MTGGYLAGHTIVLARYFDWLLANGHAETLKATYAVFRVQADPVTPYIGSFLVQFASSVLLLLVTIFAWRTVRPGILGALASALAAMALPALILMFRATGFSALEEGVMSGSDISPAAIEHWLAMNVPIHVAAAALFFVPGVLLIASYRGKS